jgi:peptide/nickel transport system permease protein
MATDLTIMDKYISSSKEKRKIQTWFRKMSENSLVAAGSLMIFGFMFIAVVGPLLVPVSPYATDFNIANHAPNLSHWFGTDNLGRDVLSRVVMGTREALGSGIIIVAIALLIGVPLGLISGFYGGWIDEIMMRLVDTGLAFPGLVLSMSISWILGPSFIHAAISVAVIMAPQFIRITRGQVLVLRDREFIQAARSHGVPSWRIMLVHILPNASTPLIVAGNLNMGYAIMIVASLSFLGLGTPPPFPSWGEMLQSGSQFLTLSPWISFAPGICLFLLVLSFTLLGEGIRDLLDVQSKGR